VAARVALALLALLARPALAATPEDQARYATWCARCHGERGDGRGPAAAALILNGRPPRVSAIVPLRTTNSTNIASGSTLKEQFPIVQPC